MHHIFPGFVCRVAGLPENYFQKLKSENISKFVEELINLDTFISEKKSFISDLLHNLISNIENSDVRNNLLKIRRKVFNLKKLDNEEIFEFLPEDIRGEYLILLELVQKREVEYYNIQVKYKADLSKIRKEFKKQINNQDFQKGLLISSKVLFDSQSAYLNSNNSSQNRKHEQIERGLLRYYSRMVMKATPFGTFCSIIPGQIKESAANGFKPFSFTSDPSLKESIILINKGLYAAILNHITKRQEIKKKLELELNQTISNDGDVFVYLTSIEEKEIFQRLESNEVLELFVKELNKHKKVVFESLIKLVCELEELEASEEEAEQYLDKLIEIGFLRFKIGIPEQQVDWVEPLCTILKGIEDEHAEKIVLLLNQLSDGIKSYKNIHVDKRTVLLKEMDNLLKSNFEEMEIKTNLKADLPFYEDATSDSTFILPGKIFKDLSGDLSDFILLTRKVASPRIEHISMRHFFDNHYKDGPEEIPLLKFYEDFYKEHYKEHLEKQQKIQSGYKDEELKKYNVSNPFDLEIVKKIQNGQTNLRNLITQKWIDNLNVAEINISKQEIENAFIDIPDSFDSSISASIFSQIIVPAANDKNKLVIPGGKYLLGYGKYFSRFLRLLSDEVQEQLINENNYMSWDIIAEISGDANFNANLHPPLVKHEISYPTSEVGLAEVQLNCNDLVVLKNPEDEFALLIKHKPSAKIVQPVDLGFLNPMMRPPLFQLLSKFTAPSSFSIQIPEKPKIFQMKAKETEDENLKQQNQIMARDEKVEKDQEQDVIIYRPRILYNESIVISRKSWIIPFTLFPSLENSETETDYFIRLNKWRTENNIPEEVYVRVKPLPVNQPPLKTEKKENETEVSGKVEEKKEEVIKKKDEEKEAEVKTEAVEKKETEIKTQIQEDKQKKTTKMSRDFYKPQYIDFLNPLLVNLFGKLTINLKNFIVTLEERYPEKTQLPEYNGEYYCTEQIFQMNFTNYNNSQVSENTEEIKYVKGDRL